MSIPEKSKSASQWGVFPNSGVNVTTQLQRAIDETAASGVCLCLEEGVYQCGTLYFLGQEPSFWIAETCNA